MCRAQRHSRFLRFPTLYQMHRRRRGAPLYQPLFVATRSCSPDDSKDRPCNTQLRGTQEPSPRPATASIDSDQPSTTPLGSGSGQPRTPQTDRWSQPVSRSIRQSESSSSNAILALEPAFDRSPALSDAYTTDATSLMSSATSSWQSTKSVCISRSPVLRANPSRRSARIAPFCQISSRELGRTPTLSIQAGRCASGINRFQEIANAWSLPVDRFLDIELGRIHIQPIRERPESVNRRIGPSILD